MRQPPPLPCDLGASRGWWARHWRWAMPLCIVAGVVVLGGGTAWSLLRWSDAVHGSAPMREAMRRVNCSAEVVAAFGEPLRAERMPLGNMQTQLNGRHDVGLMVGLEGPRGAGTLFVQGTRVDGAWDYPVMYVLGKDKRTFDLSALDDAEAAQECALAECRAVGDCVIDSLASQASLRMIALIVRSW